ncbi:hypothetical protein [Metabacillus endolithicus]|uniref:Uncharacterized protein n=1 Tax=Metabacillus endolithicus TaxID=1535204 RepID=A0ABW5C5T9_9BACI|nr:hypothetical protein [Metabacillus endolithicus]UPG66239.1 hypothetical protein MVE64_26395 [Metabacillus endolithicus]
MKIEIGIIPKKWISNIPDVGGFFPFAIDGNKDYIVDISFSTDKHLDFLTSWIKVINQFPIHMLVEVYGQEEFEGVCLRHKIEYKRTTYEKENDCFYKVTIKDYSDFSFLFPYVYANGSMNNLALWSLQRDVFSFGKREFKTLTGIKKIDTPIITLAENDSVF